MKNLPLIFGGLLLVIGFLIFSGSQSNACNLTSTSLLTITNGPGLNKTVSIRLCVGAGVTGTTNGANGDTRTIAFGWFTTLPGFSVVSFTPASITGDTTGCTMPGANAGALGPPYNTRGTVLYIDPGYYNIPPCNTRPFTCITSTVLCGRVHTQCRNFSFVLTFIPDSMRVFGVEAGGNAIGGCYPDSDMKIDFTTLGVEWGAVVAIPRAAGLEIEWTTFSEANSDHFIVQRSVNSEDFEAIGTMAALGNSSTPHTYSFLDQTPQLGANRYRIVQIDRDGHTSYSAIAEGQYGNSGKLEWTSVGPVPVKDIVGMTFSSPSASVYPLLVSDATGKVVLASNVDAQIGGNQFGIDMTAFSAGIYFVQLGGTSSRLIYKIVKE